MAVQDQAVLTDGRVLSSHDWAGAAGDKWQRYLPQFEDMNAPFGAAALELAVLQPGERVLDIGCGGGHTTLQIAAQVGALGEAVGLDISQTLVDSAKRLARDAGVPQAHFACVDAATATLSRVAFDVLFSRFGVMFFADPEAAFRNMRRMLATPARLAFCCWGPLADNPWVGKLVEVIGRHIALPVPDPDAPGPFAFADPARVRSLLQAAGFHEVQCQPWHGVQLLGGRGQTAETAADFALQALSIGDAVAAQPQVVQDAVRQDLIAVLRQHQQPEGVALPALVWLVTARC